MANPLTNTRGDLPTVNVDTVSSSTFPDTLAVAQDAITNSTRMSAIAGWNYGFDGFAWDRLRVNLTGSTSSSLGMINSAISSATGSLSVLPIGKFNATKPSLLDTQFAEAQYTSRGALLVAQDELPQAQDDTNQVITTTDRPLAVSTYCRTVYRSTALEASAVIKASAGTLRAASIRLDSTGPTGTYYIQILNAASVPANGAVTTLVAPIKLVHTNGIDQNVSLDFSANGIAASTGIVYCLSADEFTKVLSGSYMSSTFLYT